MHHIYDIFRYKWDHKKCKTVYLNMLLDGKFLRNLYLIHSNKWSNLIVRGDKGGFGCECSALSLLVCGFSDSELPEISTLLLEDLLSSCAHFPLLQLSITGEATKTVQTHELPLSPPTKYWQWVERPCDVSFGLNYYYFFLTLCLLSTDMRLLLFYLQQEEFIVLHQSCWCRQRYPKRSYDSSGRWGRSWAARWLRCSVQW